MILGIAIGIIIAILTSLSTVGMIALLFFTVGGFVAKYVLSLTFKKNTTAIITTFSSEYSINSPQNIGYVKDNFGLNSKINTNNLLVFVNNSCLNFVSADFMQIHEITKFTSQYKNILNTDFGMISIPISNIDNYRRDTSSTILTIHSDTVKRVEFSSDTAFEYFIPNKEYYFTTSKK